MINDIKKLLYDFYANDEVLFLLVFGALAYAIVKALIAFVDYIKRQISSKKYRKIKPTLENWFAPLTLLCGDITKNKKLDFDNSKSHYIFGMNNANNHDNSLPDKWIFFGYKTDKHLLTIAPTRTGKGRGLILPNLLDLPDHSIFVVDPKGENALVSARYRQSQGHKIVIFNPYSIHSLEFAKLGFMQFQSFNPLENLDPNNPNFPDDTAAIAEALIYESGGDTHWTEAARGLVEFLITYLVTEPTEKPTFERLRQILERKIVGIREIKDRCFISENESVSDNIYRYADESKEVESILGTAETQTRIFKSKVICKALDGDGFDFGHMKNSKITVYLILPSERLITQARYLRLVLLVAMSQYLRSEKGKHQVLMMLDEFANVGALKIIENGYGLIAGHGVTLWSFVQNLTQLKTLYPKNWEAFIANSAAVTVSNVNDVTTAKYFSERAGGTVRIPS